MVLTLAAVVSTLPPPPPPPPGTHDLDSHEDHDAHEDEEDGSVNPHIVEEG